MLQCLKQLSVIVSMSDLLWMLGIRPRGKATAYWSQCVKYWVCCPRCGQWMQITLV